MGWFFNKKTKKVDISLLHTDIHSHVVPGIDDGATTMEDSIQLIGEMYNIGYRKMIVTPHVRFGSFENDTDTFDRRLEQ
ncbi:MAG: capsular biosynthesis protein, partial [Bacteroidota bacterium]|nr:capsular biosynthesis protein [Bacteroidota bacterium]